MIGGAIVLLLALAGCSLGVYQYEACTTDATCREAFGFGSVCGDAGLCEDVAPDPRCERTWPEDLYAELDDWRDAVVLGGVFDLYTDGPEAQAAELAMMQLADVSGLGGRPFGLVLCTYTADLGGDALSREDAAARVTGFLAGTLGVPAIVGPSTSATAEVAYGVAAPAGTVLISPSATSSALTTIDGVEKTDASPGFFWRTAPPDSLQGEAVAYDMAARGVTDVFVIYHTGSYGEGLATVFTDAFQAGGGAVIARSFSDDTARNVAVLEAERASASEVLFISADSADVVGFLNAAREAPGFADKGIFLTDTARDLDVLAQAEAASELFDQVRGTAPYVHTDRPVYALFAYAYGAAYAPASASDSVYTAHTWDAAWLAATAVAWSAANEGAVTGLGVARGLRRVSAGDPVDLEPTHWSHIQDAFADGLDVDVTGASGELDFDPVTEETSAPIEVWSIRAGAFHSEYQVDP